MTQDSSTHLRLTLFGPPHIARADGTAVALRSRKHLALLLYLATEQRRSTSRDTLLALLWPEADEEAARNNLRVALADIRRALGDDAAAFLQTTRHTVQFDPASNHSLDVLRFRGLLDANSRHNHDALDTCTACLARLDQAVALYAGDFLHGFSLPDSGAFEEWALIQREQLHQAALDALGTLAAAYERQSEYAAQCRYARRQIELEPWREQAHAQLMRGLWASGQRGAALEQYEACRRILEAELGLEPSPELTALYEQLRAGERAEVRAVRPAPPAPDLGALLAGPNQANGANGAKPAAQNLHNLPRQLTSFIGRETQLANLRELLARARLITLTGASGCGKTRLALELAAASLPDYADGVWLVALEPLHDPALIPQAVAEALGLQTVSDQAASDLLSVALRPKQILLVLDNCEHLVAACRQLAEQLLHNCPRLTILATSREMLRLGGEVVWPVPPLSAPDGASATPEQLLGYEGIRLFVERASTVSPGFALSARNAPAVSQICRQLDSLPLAIELAAARARHMPVETIAARLGDRFGLLTQGSRAEPRQQRLRAALDWSYALLSELERICFRRLAVFAGGFTLGAAEEVAGEPGEARPDETSTVELLAQLVDKSLVVAEQRPEGLRYRLLETMRAYARDQLVQSGEAASIGDRHVACFLHLAEQAEAQLVGDEQIAWLELLAAEHANLRAAVDWATEHGGVVAALRLVTALRYFWRVRGYYAEGIELLRGLLAHPIAAGRTAVRARALNAAGYLEFVRGQQARARELLDEALAIGRALADLVVVAFALRYLSALANARQAYADARAYGEESLALYRSLGATNDIAGSSMYLGDIALAQGDDDRAEALYAESAAILRGRRNSIALPYPLRHLGYLALRRGRPEQAMALCEESLRLNLAISDQQGVAACLVGLAASAAASGRYEQAARLLGHAEGLLEALHSRLLPFDREQHERVRDAVGAQLGEAAATAASRAGRTMAIEQLLAAAEAAPKRAADAAAANNLPAQLTSLIGREREVNLIGDLLARPDCRLLTLLGPGGIGKTRLAIEVASRNSARFTDGIFLVRLASLGQPDLVAAAIAQALGIKTSGGQSPEAALEAWLQHKHLLLVLDNFEHLLGAAPLVADLLASAPRLTVLATSREALSVYGEQRFQVPPLALPPHDLRPPETDAALVMEIERQAAIALFVKRLQAVRPEFTLTVANWPAVAELCTRLDGLPLAIELAAARGQHMSPQRLLEQFQGAAGGLALLAAPARDRPLRQQTLHATIAWSYELLSDQEQTLFRRLAVFAGGWTTEAAEVVAAAGDNLTALADKSLVAVGEGADGEPRFVMLETIKEYALERLHERGETAGLRERHAVYYLDLAEAAEPLLAGGRDELIWWARLQAEQDNMRVALRWALGAHAIHYGLRLAGALWKFWDLSNNYQEGRAWLTELLTSDAQGATPAQVRAKALNGIAMLALRQADAQAATAYIEESVALYRAHGDERGLGRALLTAGNVAALGYGDIQEAVRLSEAALALHRSVNDRPGMAVTLFNLGLSGLSQGDDAQARVWFEEAQQLYSELGSQRWLVRIQPYLTAVLLMVGEHERAAALLTETVTWWERGVERDLTFVTQLILVAAGIAEAYGQPWQAAMLLGALNPFDAIIGAPGHRIAAKRRLYEMISAAVRAHLDEAQFTTAAAAGESMTLDQTLAAVRAVGTLSAPATQMVPDQQPAPGHQLPAPGLAERPRAIEAAPATPPAPAPAPPHNLPSPLSSFVGRADELARLAALLTGDTRLATLTGPGGAGKTRMALAIAWQLLPQFADGVWWVALAGVQPTDDPGLQRGTLASAVATALGRTLGGRRDPLGELADVLHERAALLVLDNCEHLPEIGALARALLEAAPNVRVVATSREPLGLGGEALLRLEGLAVPPPGAADPASYPGVQLFLERAAQHAPGWEQGESNGAVVRLCRLLDGLPLAIELAAHWVGHYTPDEIAEEIEADLDFLAARTRDLPDRHRSLRAVFDYAWRSLNATEQQALMRISVFRSSFDRAAAQAVANVRGTTLVGLADKSLLQQAGVGRYNLHELLRQFAAERLGASGEAASIRAQHAAYYLALAEQAAPELSRPDQAAALERLDRAIDNLRAALSWMWEQRQTALGLRLAGALERFWFTRGYFGEGREWLERFLTPANAAEVAPAVRAQAFSAAGLLANTQGDYVQATRWLEEGLASYRAANDLAGAVRALTTLGGVAYDQGDLRGAVERWEQSLAQARAVGDLGEVARALGNIGEAEYHLGDLTSAAARHTEALALARQLGRANLEAFQLGDLGNVARRQGDLARATTLHKQALELKRALGARRQIAITLEDLASVAAAEGRGARAACLIGAAAAIREAIGTPQAIPERRATEQAVAEARAALGQEAWAAAFREGLALSLDDAIGRALE